MSGKAFFAGFSLERWWAVFLKEFIQMRRDRVTLGMMVGVPLMQLVLFGYAINTDPKHMPAALVLAENSVFARSLVRAIENTEYLRFNGPPVDTAAAERMLAIGTVQFVITVPPNFAEDIVRGRAPILQVEADATDPVTTANALAALSRIDQTALRNDLTGALGSLQGRPQPVSIVVHRRYNEEGLTRYNVVPGLMGVVLTMTMVMMTALAMTRERERGTMESLLAMPIRPVEVMLGKIVPFIFVGYVQVAIVLVAARFLFGVPIAGSLTLLSTCAVVFIAANLAVGFTFSTLAQNQLQAIQLSTFFFLPSLILSGFMFPFRGMPEWAQILGQMLPLTHFIRIVRGILLKGNGFFQILPELWPIMLFFLAASILALLRYRQTLD